MNPIIAFQTSKLCTNFPFISKLFSNCSLQCCQSEKPGKKNKVKIFSLSFSEDWQPVLIHRCGKICPQDMIWTNLYCLNIQNCLTATLIAWSPFSSLSCPCTVFLTTFRLHFIQLPASLSSFKTIVARPSYTVVVVCYFKLLTRSFVVDADIEFLAFLTRFSISNFCKHLKLHPFHDILRQHPCLQMMIWNETFLQIDGIWADSLHKHYVTYASTNCWS